MLTFRRLLVVFNEVAVLLSITGMNLLSLVKTGIRSVTPSFVVINVVYLLLCLLLPWGLKNPGLPLSKFLAGAGACVVSMVGMPALAGMIAGAVTLMTGHSFVDSNPHPALLIVFSFLYLFDVIICVPTAMEWVEEKRAALPQREIRKLERIREIAAKAFFYLFSAVAIVFGLWLTIWTIRNNWGRSLSDIGRDAINIIITSIQMAAPYLFVIFLGAGIRRLLDGSDRKSEQRVNTIDTVESCLEKETMQSDMEALTLLERLQNDTRKRAIHSRAAILVMISQAQYRIGDFDKAKESIREAFGLYEIMVRQEGGDIDVTLYMKATLYDVSSKISGLLKDYGKKLDDCRAMIDCLERHPAAYVHRYEIGKAYIEMADALRGLGQYEEALRSCDRAREELEELPPEESAAAKCLYALLNRVKAEILLDQGEIEEAEKCASESIEMYGGMKEGYECPIGAAHLIMGKIQSERGNSEKAETEYLIAEALIRDRYGKNHPVYTAVFHTPRVS